MEIIVLMIAHWRIALATLGAILLAFVLLAVIAPLTGRFVVVMACVGCGVGLLWEATAATSKRK
jgi:hypothetical protein